MPSFANHGSDWAEACRNRDTASPIDLDGPILGSPATQDPFQYSYAELATVEVTNNGRALEVALPGMGGMYHPNAGWHDLKELRLRGGAEHTLAGHRAELELQVVHSHPATGGLLIASILFDLAPGSTFNRSEDVLVNYTAPADGDASPFLAPLVASRPPRLDETVQANVSGGEMDLNLLMDAPFVEYAGEDTLPPCSNALWMVRREPRVAGSGQLAKLGQALRDLSAGFGNYRTVMPLNQRVMAVRNGQREQAQVGVQSSVGNPFADGPVYGPYRGREAPAVFAGDAIAQDALTINKYVADYARDLDYRLQAAARARIEPVVPATPAPKPLLGAPAPGAMATLRALGDAARTIDAAVKTTLTGASVQTPARGAVKELAKSYTREAVSTAVNQTGTLQPMPSEMRGVLRGAR